MTFRFSDTAPYLPADYVGFGEAFEAAANADPLCFEAWAMGFDHVAAQCEADQPGCTTDALTELVDKAERRGAISADMAHNLRGFFELN